MQAPPREHWKSRLGFILATSGAAIGLGNIQRFPYITAEFGGALFVLIYLGCVLLLGLPLILNEFAIGRYTHQNPYSAIQAIRKKGPWKYVGLLGVLVAFFIFTYYLVISAWTLGYTISMLSGTVPEIDTFSADWKWVLAYMAVFLLATIYVVQEGLQDGIEKYGKILMPLLLLLLIGLMIRSVTLPNSWAGIEFYLYPDWSELHPKVFLYALSQAFFSLCVGEAVLMTYGSYAAKTEDLVSSAGIIALFDTFIAFLSGLVIFPAIFSLGEDPKQGVGLIFKVIPNIFSQLPFGSLLGGAFFLMLGFAAFTTCIALLEMPVTLLIETTQLKRKQATWLMGGVAFILAIPSALSKGANEFLSELSIPFFEGKGFYEIMDLTWGGLGMVIVGLFLSIFTGWIWGTENAVKEINEGCSFFSRFSPLWSLIVKWVAPALILIILVGLFL